MTNVYSKPCVDLEHSVSGGRGEGPDNIFLSQHLFQRAVQTPLKKQLDRLVQLLLMVVSTRLLRKPIATCDFPRGSAHFVSPLYPLMNHILNRNAIPMIVKSFKF